MPTSTRSGAIDLVRLLGVIAVVAGHAWTEPVTQDWFYAWHVPVFFILSGYLWRSGRPLKDEVTKRGATLGRPYLAWFLILTAALVALGFVRDEPVIERIVGGALGGAFAILPYTTLWFVSALFFSAVLFRAIENLPYLAQWAVAITGAVAGWIWGPELSYTPLGIGYAVTCLIYLLIGQAFRAQRDAIPAPLPIGLLLIAAPAALVALNVVEPLDIKLGDYGTPVASLLASSAISIGLVLVAETLVRPGKFSQWCTLLALPMLTVVLAHPMFLWVPGPAWLKFATGLLIPLAVGLLALRTPLAPWITGQPRSTALVIQR